MWHQWFNCSFMKLWEYFLCTKETKIMTLFKNVFSSVLEFDTHSRMPVSANVQHCGRTRDAWAFCPLGSHLVTSRPVFGLFRYLWSMLHPKFNQTAPEFIWKRIETSDRFVCIKVRWAAVTLIQMSHTSRAIRVCFNRTKHAKCSTLVRVWCLYFYWLIPFCLSSF